MQKKRLIILYSAAGAVALAVAYAASTMLGGNEPKPVKKVAVPKGSVEILVAANRVQAGAVITGKNLKWKSWPKQALLPGMIQRKRNKNAISRISQARTIVPLEKGEPILESKLLFPEDGSYLSAMLAPGMRALAIPVTMVRTAGGYVRPYDRVDLLFVEKGGDLSTAEVVMENVKVLAINKTAVGQKAKGSKGGPKPLGSATRAVLEVTLPQARVLTKLTRKGRIFMALRSLADKSASGEPKLVGYFAELVKDDPDSEFFSGGIRVISRGIAQGQGR